MMNDQGYHLPPDFTGGTCSGPTPDWKTTLSHSVCNVTVSSSVIGPSPALPIAG